MRILSSPTLGMASLPNFSHSNQCEWYLTVVSMACSQAINYFEHFSCAFLPSLWQKGKVRCLFKSFAHFLFIGCLFSYYFWKFFIFSRCKSLNRYVICKWLFSVCALTESFQKHKFLISIQFNSSISSFKDSVFGAGSKKSSPTPRSQNFLLSFLLELSCFYVLYLGVWSIFISFLFGARYSSQEKAFSLSPWNTPLAPNYSEMSFIRFRTFVCSWLLVCC